MENKIILAGTGTLTLAAQVAKICKPLKEILDIPFFRYGVFFHDKSRLILSNMPECFQFFYEEGYYSYTWNDNTNSIECYETDWLVWAIKKLQNSEDQSIMEAEIKKLFGLCDGITYRIKYSNYVEIFDFASKNPNIYQISKETLVHFMHYFKQEAYDLILKAHSNKIIMPTITNDSQNAALKDKESRFTQLTKINKYYLGNVYKNVYLSNREVDCIDWCIKGKTVEQIASILNIKKKTVEHHFENIRQKLNCYKQSQLVTIAIRHGICKTAISPTC
jgi:DNA-binding CsgD family transcriptional regulator